MQTTQHAAETVARTLSFARNAYASATDPRDREFYAGMIDRCDNKFDEARCQTWRVPREKPDYCEGGEEAMIRLHQDVTETPERFQHGDVIDISHL